MADLRPIVALFLREDSGYLGMPGVDCYPASRDARTFPGGMPGIYHPPCRAWGVLWRFAKPLPHEKDLARWAVARLRESGGVLEHPAGSKLWADQDLPVPGAPADAWGGYTIQIDQYAFGHRAAKKTWLYIVGCPRHELPAIPTRQGWPTHVITNSHGMRKGDPNWRPRVGDAEREATPEPLRRWLAETARRCHVQPLRAAA